MTSPGRSLDFWRWPALLLWVVFLVAGLFPEKIFYLLRDWGEVMTQTAAINSPWVLVVALTAYIACFSYFGCREAEIDVAEAQGKALQIAIIAMLAFLPLRLEQYREYFLIPVAAHRRLLLTICGAKCLAWLYLFITLLRYYAGDGKRVFQRMPSIFPSVHRQQETAAPSVSGAESQETAAACGHSPQEGADLTEGDDQALRKNASTESGKFT